MLRVVPNTSPAGAKNYYSSADYYSEGQELQGRWHGRAAAMLGLTENGVISKADWDALCDNRAPGTGKKLTPRTKDVRRVGYDLNFHAPKSVSLLYALTNDERLLGAFRESVDSTMREMEAEMKTRVRTGGQDADRTTGNMLWGEYVHFTSRPVGGEPDPHLHAHCFAFNVTYDGEEERWKAAQFGDLKRDASYFEAVFHNQLARRLEVLGLPVERTRTGWEITGVGRGTLDRFSRRTAQIEAKAKEKGITSAHEKDALGARTREKKAKSLGMDELRAAWKDRLSGDEIARIEALAECLGRTPDGDGGPNGPQARMDMHASRHTAERAAAHAVEHAFERQSVVSERTLIAHALKHAVGKASRDEIKEALRSHNLIFAERFGGGGVVGDVSAGRTGTKGRTGVERVVTTAEVLQEEQRMLDFARKGRGACPALGRENARHYEFGREYLSDEQKAAVRHVLRSRDRVTLIRGAAGVGKTTMMKEAIEALESVRGVGGGGGENVSSVRVLTFAPSAAASRGVLREQEHLRNADTVAKLLHDPKLQAQVEDRVIWIDEAGLLSTKDMAKVFELAEKRDARIILSGDRRQHGSVERGSALRLLETQAGLVPAEIREIRRQKGDYKQAVHALGDGRIAEGFRRLDDLGWIREVNGDQRYEMLASDFVESVQAGKSALVVAPTRAEGERITRAIRDRLKEAGKIKSDEERAVFTLENANLTVAERRDPLHYHASDYVVFHQNAKGYTKGFRRPVVDPRSLPLEHAERFHLYRAGEIRLAPGDTIRITRNGKTRDGAHALHNGSTYTLRAFTPEGDLVLTNGWCVSRIYGHLDHGYATTSHASQGKSVDRVFVGQSSHSLRAASPEQFYVSVSRGKERASIYTDNKRELLDAVTHADERLSAVELQKGRAKERTLAIIRESISEAVRRTVEVARDVVRGRGVEHAHSHSHPHNSHGREARSLA